jgi:hypothetical protein
VGEVDYLVESGIDKHAGVKVRIIWNHDARDWDDELKEKWLGLLKICQIEKPLQDGGKEEGLWLYSPSKFPSYKGPHPFSLSLKVSLPHNLSGLSLLSTVGAVWKTSLSLGSPTSIPIDQFIFSSAAGSLALQEGVSVNNADIKLQAGNIIDKVSVKEGLKIVGSAGDVRLRVEILDGGESSPVPITVSTSAGTIDLEYIYQPKYRAIDSSISSAVGAISIKHAANFTGSFEAHANIGSMDTHFMEDSERDFVVTKRREGWGNSEITGRVEWKDEEKGSDGKSIVKTSAGKIELTF